MPCYELTPLGVNGLREFSTTLITTLLGREVICLEGTGKNKKLISRKDAKAAKERRKENE